MWEIWMGILTWQPNGNLWNRNELLTSAVSLTGHSTWVGLLLYLYSRDRFLRPGGEWKLVRIKEQSENICESLLLWANWRFLGKVWNVQQDWISGVQKNGLLLYTACLQPPKFKFHKQFLSLHFYGCLSTSRDSRLRIPSYAAPLDRPSRHCAHN